MTGDLRQSRDPRSLLLPLCLFAALLLPATARSSQNKPFKLDLDETETESGERLQLHSQGSLAETVDLDTLPQVKVGSHTMQKYRPFVPLSVQSFDILYFEDPLCRISDN